MSCLHLEVEGDVCAAVVEHQTEAVVHLLGRAQKPLHNTQRTTFRNRQNSLCACRVNPWTLRHSFHCQSAVSQRFILLLLRRLEIYSSSSSSVSDLLKKERLHRLVVLVWAEIVNVRVGARVVGRLRHSFHCQSAVRTLEIYSYSSPSSVRDSLKKRRPYRLVVLVCAEIFNACAGATVVGRYVTVSTARVQSIRNLFL